MAQLVLVSHHTPLLQDVLPEPAVVATITTDPRLLGPVNPEKLLETLAAKLGLLQYTITATDPLLVPGYQFDLFTRRR